MKPAKPKCPKCDAKMEKAGKSWFCLGCVKGFVVCECGEKNCSRVPVPR